MTEHTKEPWSVAGIADEMIVAKVSELAHAHIATIHHNENDSRRIVACVNACRGLPTEELEQKGLVSSVGAKLIEADKRIDNMDLVIDKAKYLLTELRKDIELTIHNNKVVNNSRVVAIAEAKLQRIDEILNWKGNEQ